MPTLDQSSALAEKYKTNRQVLEAAVLGRGNLAGIDPYSALRALQKLNMADKYEQMQTAMAGKPSAPSIAQQTLVSAMQPAPQQMPQQAGGLAGMPVSEDTFRAAGGGIVAFAGGGDPSEADSSEVPEILGKRGAPEIYAQLTGKLPAAIEQMTQYAPASMAPKDYETIFKGALAEQKQAAGPDIYEDVQRKLSGLETDRGENLEKAKGLAALQAAAAMAQGSNFTRGLAGAASAFGSSYGKALEADAEQKRALISAQFQMADAKRKEAIGMHKEARASADAARTAFKDAQKLELDKRKYAVDALVRGAAATQTTTRPAPTGGSGAAALKQQAFASFYNMFKNQFPNETHDQITTRAYGAVAQLGAGNIPADITRQKLVENSVTKEKTENPTQWNARVQKFMGMGSNFSAAQEQAAQEVRAQAEAVYPSSVFTPYSPSEPPRISKDSSGLSTLPPGFKPRK